MPIPLKLRIYNLKETQAATHLVLTAPADCSCGLLLRSRSGHSIQPVCSECIIGEYNNGNPIHLHGHSFQVVYIILATQNRALHVAAHARDIPCADESWRAVLLESVLNIG